VQAPPRWHQSFIPDDAAGEVSQFDVLERPLVKTFRERKKPEVVSCAKPKNTPVTDVFRRIVWRGRDSFTDDSELEAVKVFAQLDEKPI